ncbi:hypothetical protein [Archaeoglobus sp.]
MIVAPRKQSLDVWKKIKEIEMRNRLLESKVIQLENERNWLSRELNETYKELLEERKKRINLEKLLNDIIKIPKSEKHTSESTTNLRVPSHEVWKSDLVKESKRFLEALRNKIEKGKELTKEELKKFVEIDILADKHPELKKLVREIIILLEKVTSPEIVELKDGEIRELDEDILVRKRKDGVIEIITL